MSQGSAAPGQHQHGQHDASTRAGFLAAAGGFIFWGLAPVYWKQIDQIGPLEILCHRIVWSCVFTGLALLLMGRLHEVRPAFASPRTMLHLLVASLLIGVNWLLFIWAVNSGRILETSLGYYINPLVNALLGRLIFKDTLRPLQRLAILIAAAGVSVQVLAYGKVPWVSLSLAITFAMYGLTRKLDAVGSLPGLFLETTLLSVPALGYLLWLGVMGQGAFLAQGLTVTLILIGAGPVTSLPLAGFAFGARRLRLTTLGLLQYLAPSIAFMLGVFIYHEPLTTGRLITFICIWCALALYAADTLRMARTYARLSRR